MSHHMTCVMDSVNVIGLDNFKKKSLTSSRKYHRNALIRILSSQLTSHANWRKSTAWIEVGRDPRHREQSFVVVVQTLLVPSNVLLNLVRKLFKSSRRGNFFSNNGTNHDNIALDSKVPMKPTWDAPLGYCWGCIQNISWIWLTKPQNLDCIPSKFSSILTFGSLTDCRTG